MIVYGASTAATVAHPSTRRPAGSTAWARPIDPRCMDVPDVILELSSAAQALVGAS
jgi:hypothetical protein